jgi:hypothetical protein
MRNSTQIIDWKAFVKIATPGTKKQASDRRGLAI